MKDSASHLPGAFSRHSRQGQKLRSPVWVLLLSLALIVPACADELKTVTGERLIGKTVSVTDKTVVFWSPAVGKVSVARSNVVALSFAPGATNSPPVSTTNVVQSFTNVNHLHEISVLLNSLPANGGDIAGSLSSELLVKAGPEATSKFNEMVQSLMTGRMSVADVRKQAHSVRDQARALRLEMGDDAAILDGYLMMLDKFLGEAPPAATPEGKTNRTAPTGRRW